MAEYYAVLKKAVGGLDSGSAEARRAVYDKARNALIGQLKAIDPPLAAAASGRSLGPFAAGCFPSGDPGGRVAWLGAHGRPPAAEPAAALRAAYARCQAGRELDPIAPRLPDGPVRARTGSRDPAFL